MTKDISEGTKLSLLKEALENGSIDVGSVLRYDYGYQKRTG